MYCFTYPTSRQVGVLSIHRLLSLKSFGRPELILRCSTISALNYGHRLLSLKSFGRPEPISAL
jgi:hypothetical protein